MLTGVPDTSLPANGGQLHALAVRSAAFAAAHSADGTRAHVELQVEGSSVKKTQARATS